MVVTIMIRIRTKEEEQTSRPNHNMSFPNQALSLSLRQLKLHGSEIVSLSPGSLQFRSGRYRKSPKLI